MNDYKIIELIFLFFIFSFIGYLSEITYNLIKNKKFFNRGFLFGPYCPIYGYGSVFLIILLKNKNIFTVFVLSMLITTLLEFLTGLVLEKVFNKKWWDYSNKKFNIMGYITLTFSFIWGIAGIIIIKIFYPLFHQLYNLIYGDNFKILIFIIMIIFILDNIITLLNIFLYLRKLKNLNKYLSIKNNNLITDDLINNIERSKFNKYFNQNKNTR